MNIRKHVFSIVVFVSLCCSLSCGALDFEALLHAPANAPDSTYLVVKALPNGCLLVWNGDTVYRQRLPRADSFKAIATGYAGDPGFMAVSPDGHTVLLGAGYSGKLYLLDLEDPQPYSASAEIAPAGYPEDASPYSGVFLTASLFLMDSGSMTTSSPAELGIFDVQNPSGGYRRVMQKPATLAAGDNSYSATVAIDAARTWVYAMSYVLDSSWASTTQLKRISASALVQAYGASATLNWDSDAAAIGAANAFFTTGPSDVMSNGDVLVTGTGGVQRVEPSTASVVGTYTPLSDPLDSWRYSYSAAYNAVTGDVMLAISDWHTYTAQLYAPDNTFTTLPVMGLPGGVALLCALAFAGRRRLR